jgi:2-polyprenyl-6-methoxyphenol hydroxylase-like FAD-dependent oxidoreductase
VEILAHCGALASLGGLSALQPVADLPVYSCTQRDGPVRLLYSLRAAAPREGVFGAPPARACVAYSAPQWRVERALADALRARPAAELRYATRLLAFDAQTGGVLVTLAPAAAATTAAAAAVAAAGDKESGWEVVSSPDATAAAAAAAAPPPSSASTTLRCKYLVGADGVGSGVRAALSIPRDGAAYEELFLIADVRLTSFSFDLHSRPTFLHGEPACEAAQRFVTRDCHMAPLGDDRFRVFFVVDAAAPRKDLVDAFRALYAGPASGDGADVAGVAATRAWMQAAMGEYGLSCVITDVQRISRYGVWLGVASAPRGSGPGGSRVFLAGDAAHSHSPHGGQGANAGLQDGWNLGWKLALAARPGAAATEALLASYGAERAPVWRRVVALADALKRLSAEPHPRSVFDAAARAAWRLLPDVAQRRLLLERLAHKAFVYTRPLGAEDARTDGDGSGGAVANTPHALPPAGGAGPGAQPCNAWVVALPVTQLSGTTPTPPHGQMLQQVQPRYAQQMTLYDALWGADSGGGFVLLFFAAGVSARAAGVTWGAAARAHAAALLLVAFAWGVSGPRVGVAAAAVWAARASRLAAHGPATTAPPLPPRWEHFAQLAARAAGVPGLAGLRAAVVLPEGAPLPPDGPPPGLRALIDVEGGVAAACGVRGSEAMLLLRPDGHVALRAARAHWQPLADYLPRLFTRLGPDAGEPGSSAG